MCARINDFNFRATVDQDLLVQLAKSAGETDSLAQSTTSEAGRRIDEATKLRLARESHKNGGRSFKLISRRAIKKAAGAMVRSMDSEHDNHDFKLHRVAEENEEDFIDEHIEEDIRYGD